VATMSIRGTTTTIPLEFVRLQPYVSPKIELSDQRLEKVDLRVLPAIFRFQPPRAWMSIRDKWWTSTSVLRMPPQWRPLVRLD